MLCPVRVHSYNDWEGLAQTKSLRLEGCGGLLLPSISGTVVLWFMLVVEGRVGDDPHLHSLMQAPFAPLKPRDVVVCHPSTGSSCVAQPLYFVIIVTRRIDQHTTTIAITDTVCSPLSMLRIESSSVHDFAKCIFVMINSQSDWFSEREEGEKEARKEGREGGRGKEGK